MRDDAFESRAVCLNDESRWCGFRSAAISPTTTGGNASGFGVELAAGLPSPRNLGGNALAL
jgi:hypothetical protein